MGESGRNPSVTLDDALGVFVRCDDPHAPLTAAEVAAELGCPSPVAYRRLTELNASGALKSKKIGGGERVWWRAGDATDDASPDDRATDRVEAREDDPPQTRQDDLRRELDEVYERITDAFYALDEEWRFTYVNDRAEEIIRRSEAEILGERIWDEFPEAKGTVVWEKYHEAVETQEPVQFELRYDPLDVWVEVNAYPSETGLSVHFVDISERVEREQELRRYKEIIETMNDGVYAVDPDGHFTMVNEAYARMTGRSREELVGEHVSEVADEETVRKAKEVERKLVGGKRDVDTVETELRTEDGETVVAEATFALLWYDDEYERIGVVRDVTERREYERAVEEQRERYRRLVQAAPVAIAICDADGRIVFANDAAVEGAGATDASELLGESVTRFVHPDDRERAGERMRRVVEDREATDPEEMKVRTSDGEVRHAIVTGVPVTHEGEPAAQVVLTDITERRRYERQLAETVEELKRSNERLDSFASMLAHELRDPLTIAQIYVSRAGSDREGGGPDEDDAESDGTPTALEQVADALDRMEAMVDVLLVLAKGSDEVGGGERVDLAAVAEEAWSNVDHSGATLSVETEQVVRGDADHVQHLFRNLFRNAVEHGDEDVTVRVGPLDDAEGSGDSVRGFYVADDGPGIPEEVRERVFEAGYSTDDDGIGLGLTFVERLADAYDWDCTITDGEVDEGTDESGGARFEFTGVDIVTDE